MFLREICSVCVLWKKNTFWIVLKYICFWYRQPRLTHTQRRKKMYSRNSDYDSNPGCKCLCKWLKYILAVYSKLNSNQIQTNTRLYSLLDKYCASLQTRENQHWVELWIYSLCTTRRLCPSWYLSTDAGRFVLQLDQYQ